MLVSSALHRFDFPCYRLARIEYATCRAIMAGYLPGSEQSASKPLLVIEGTFYPFPIPYLPSDSYVIYLFSCSYVIGLLLLYLSLLSLV